MAKGPREWSPRGEDGEEYNAGGNAAYNLANALFNLGFPWDKVGDEGLLFVSRFSEDAPKGRLAGMRKYFKDLKGDPPDIPPHTFEPGTWPSEYVVTEELLQAVPEAVDENMPWAAAAIFDILSDYESHLMLTDAGPRLFERSARLRHAISDVEDRAAGRA